VSDNSDVLDHSQEDRVMQRKNAHCVHQCQEESTNRVRDGAPCVRRTGATGTKVLIIVGISSCVVSRELTHAAALSSPNGITLNVFDNLTYLPSYSEAFDGRRLPRPAAALRNAAIEAHAAIVLIDYYGNIPAVVHNAIDWLTRRWSHGALHDKPLAVIGPTEDGYSGVWSRHQTEELGRIAGSRVVEPITVATLHEAVTKLAGQRTCPTNDPHPCRHPGPHA
jgi:NAD(P)H-dependent FMN reductase